MKRYSFYSPYELDTVAYEDSEGTLVDADIAQDLYDALEGVVDYLSPETCPRYVFNKVLKSIAKANGEDQ